MRGQGACAPWLATLHGKRARKTGGRLAALPTGHARAGATLRSFRVLANCRSLSCESGSSTRAVRLAWPASSSPRQPRRPPAAPPPILPSSPGPGAFGALWDCARLLLDLWGSPRPPWGLPEVSAWERGNFCDDGVGCRVRKRARAQATRAASVKAAGRAAYTRPSQVGWQRGERAMGEHDLKEGGAQGRGRTVLRGGAGGRGRTVCEGPGATRQRVKQQPGQPATLPHGWAHSKQHNSSTTATPAIWACPASSPPRRARAVR